MISFFDFKFTYNLFNYDTFIIMKKIVIVGGGINGLVAANYLVKEGYDAVSYTHLTLPTKRIV